MAFLFTGVQHLKTGDAVIPIEEHGTEDGYKKRYHEEMSYAMNNADFIGLGIKVFNSATLEDVLKDNWVKSV